MSPSGPANVNWRDLLVWYREHQEPALPEALKKSVHIPEHNEISSSLERGEVDMYFP